MKRQKDDCHQDDRAYGKHEFMAEVADALPHHMRLIRDKIDVYIGRQERSKLGHNLVKAITQLGDIFALLHFDGQQDTRLSIKAYKEDRVLVAPFDLSQVLDIDRLTCFRDVDHNICDLVFRGKRPRCSRSEEHTSELQSRPHLVCRLLLEKKKKKTLKHINIKKKKKKKKKE